MKLRETLKRLDLWLRPAQVHGEDGKVNRTVDNVDAFASAPAHVVHTADGAAGVADVPPGYVPSQQDWGRPPH